MKVAIVTNKDSFVSMIGLCFCEPRESFEVFVNDAQLIRALSRKSFDAIIVDALNISRLEAERPVFASRYCLASDRAPLILVGTFADIASIEQAIAVGADDFVRYPVSMPELRVRTYLAVRRHRLPARGDLALNVGSYHLDRSSGMVRYGSNEVYLTAREFALAWMLFAQLGEYVSKTQIAETIWGSDSDTSERTIEQYVYRLRKKLCLTGAHGVKLGTRYSHGYRIEMPSASQCAKQTHASQCAGLRDLEPPGEFAVAAIA